MKIKSTIGIVNPVAKAMLQERKPPQVVPPKKDDWKRERKIARQTKQNLRRKVA